MVPSHSDQSLHRGSPPGPQHQRPLQVSRLVRILLNQARSSFPRAITCSRLLACAHVAPPALLTGRAPSHLCSRTDEPPAPPAAVPPSPPSPPPSPPSPPGPPCPPPSPPVPPPPPSWGHCQVDCNSYDFDDASQASMPQPSTSLDQTPVSAPSLSSVLTPGTYSLTKQALTPLVAPPTLAPPTRARNPHPTPQA